MLREISDLKDSMLLEYNHTLLNGIIESSPHGIFSLDREYRYTSFNQAHARAMKLLYGADIELGHSLYEYQNVEEDIAFSLVNIGRAMNGERFIRKAFTGSRKLSRIYVEHNLNPIKDEYGNVIGVSIFSQDISERKQAAEALRQSEGRVRAKLDAVLMPEGDIGMLELADIIQAETIQSSMDDFFSLTQIGSALVDLDGKVLASTKMQDICARFHRAHPEACQNCLESDTKLSSGIELGQFKAYRCKNNMWDIATPVIVGDRHFGNFFIGQFFYKNEEIDYEVFRAQARKYGFNEEEYLNALARVPRLDDDTVKKAMSFYSRFSSFISTLSYSNLKLARTLEKHKQTQDAQAKLQAQLNHAQKMESIGQLAGGVAHDFNNMLSIINGYTEIMTETLSPSDPMYTGLREIHNAGKRSAMVVKKLLAFARKQTIYPVMMDLNQSVSSMLEMLGSLIGENIELVWKPGDDLWMIKMDYSQIDQILANLMVNARDAISDIGKITIETRNAEIEEAFCTGHRGFFPGQFVMLAVSDNGCGMDREIQKKLFEPFFTTKDVGKGTGLGLSTIYGIVEQHNGFIDVCSEPGKGTIFSIYFPRHMAD